jgi:tetratricopeptide (TPR) repeat protein
MSRSLASSILIVTWLTTPAMAQNTQTQGPCSPIIDKTGGPVTINFSGGCTSGIDPDQLKAIIESVQAKRAIPPELIDRYEALGQKFGVTNIALTTFFRILGESQVETSDLDIKLREIAGQYLTLLKQAGSVRGFDPEATALKNKALAEIKAGHYADAENLLQRAVGADLAGLRSAQEALDNRHLAAAQTKAVFAQLKLTQLQYAAAAQAFKEAADLVPQGHEDRRHAYLDREASALFRQGEDVGDNSALAAAIDRYRVLLALRPRERVPLEWAMTQSNLGSVLRVLGERENSTARLEEAVAAFRAALTERTRERVPLDWAATQNNLGTALQRLGELENGTARLEQAVAAFRAALTERTRERVPLDWARTQDYLGNALGWLGERESGTARFEEAVAAHRAALTEITRERAPVQWATTQNNLGFALERLGERENGTARLEEALTVLEAALTERPRERVPVSWAMSMGNHGVVLMLLAGRTADAPTAQTAVSQMDLALTTLREHGHARLVAYYEVRLPKARALAERLSKR